MGTGARTLASYPLRLVRLACTKCSRRGQYRRDHLIADHGADIAMPGLRHVLARCERRGKLGDTCGVFYPDLMRRAHE
jgi:hypothetical protein